MLDQTAVAPMAAAISRKARRLMMGIGGYLTQGDVHRLDGADLIQKAPQHLFEAAPVFQKNSMSAIKDLQAVIGKYLERWCAALLGNHEVVFGPRLGEPGSEHGAGVMPNFLRVD